MVLRCVPCLACAGIDAQVLLQETELAPLLDQFVCVRVINANALDLSLFQFDYDLSFSTLFFNGDGTVYGRYGSWRASEGSAGQDHRRLPARARSRARPAPRLSGEQSRARRQAGRPDAVQDAARDSRARRQISRAT